MNQRWWAVLLLAGALLVGRVARLDPQPATPAQRDPAQAEAWMVDGLPGVGPKHLAGALAAVRAGRFDDLPKPARAMARTVFLAGTAPLKPAAGR